MARYDGWTVDELLAEVELRARRKRRADRQNRAALLAAHTALLEAGVSRPYAKLAKACGRERQLVRQQIMRWLEADEDPYWSVTE